MNNIKFAIEPSKKNLAAQYTKDLQVSDHLVGDMEKEAEQSPIISVAAVDNGELSELGTGYTTVVGSDADHDKGVPKVTDKYSDSIIRSTELEDVSHTKRLSSVEWTFNTNVTEVGAIDLAFPENPDKQFTEVECLPLSYYTLTGKERLLLAFAENFRRQFVASVHYVGRGPILLAPKNECGVQKFVCTTIRPTAFLIPKLIGNWEECASFVADFIVYEHLENPLDLPPRLISPDTLLRARYGNCYEMATLLCSMLIGEGFAAVVVSGSATIETTVNDQRRVICPFTPNEHSNGAKTDEVVIKNKYELNGPPDLKSKFMIELKEKAAQQEHEEQERQLMEEKERIETLSMRPPDKFRGRRMHAWVAVIENAPWCYKPRQKIYDDDGEEVIPEAKAFFIEPSTGFRHEVTSSNYLRIDSVWNNYNYYINRQEPTENGLADMKWDLGNTEQWEHFLPAEPFELRPNVSVSQDLEQGNVFIEKHLDVIPSWVSKLQISMKKFESRYPNNEKSIYYKETLYQRYSPYCKYDGLVKRLTIFEDLDYQRPLKRWEWYANRTDLLNSITIDFQTKLIEEGFLNGRKDCLKYFVHSAKPNKPKIFNFYHFPRLDCLKRMEITANQYTYHYQDRVDLCYFQNFQIKTKDRLRCHNKPIFEITEKFHRNAEIPINKDIAVRQFQLTHNKIVLQFQYAKGAITASTREFIKPPRTDYGEDIIFDPSQFGGYIANPLEIQLTQAEVYFQLLEQIKREKDLKKLFEKRCAELEELLTRRKTEMLNPRLEFSIFDPLRNEGARRIRLEEYEKNRLRMELLKLQEPDFLAPYLVPYEKRKPNFDESWAAYNACLNDVKSHYTSLLNQLQRRYVDLTSEGRDLKKFMDRFQDQFDDFDYDRIMQEAKEIELNKRTVQQRLILAHEEAQSKYEKIKESLQHDERLRLRKGTAFNE